MSKAAATRATILHKAFELIYTKGYQTTSVDDIIATVQVTKGAFFYHFKNKDEMGAAIIEELLKPTMINGFIEPMEQSKNPVKDIYNTMKYLLLDDENMQVAYGCPAGNLTHEMAPRNETFTLALNELMDVWQQAMKKSIANGKAAGLVRKDVNASQVAMFVMAGYWGVRNVGKLYNSNAPYITYLKELKIYLKNLQ